jgi:hypothetical protein
LDTEISDGRSSKTFPLVADDYSAVSIPDASMAGDEEDSELDSRFLNDKKSPNCDMYGM